MFHIAMLSRWHPHGTDNRYVKEAALVPDTRITCVWDEMPDRGRQWADELGCQFEPDIDALLKRSSVDGVCVTAPTTMHKELIIKAARAGKHIFTEKTLCLSPADALEIQDVIQETGVKFCIAYPRRSNPEFAYLKKLIDEGKLGDITMLRVRNGNHSANLGTTPDYWFKSEQTGGGAMIDLGCHPIYLAFWLMGVPKRVNAQFAYLPGIEVEVSAVANLVFGNGAIGMIETTDAAPLIDVYTLEAFGTKGNYIARTSSPDVEVKYYGERTRRIPISMLPKADDQPMKQWVDACQRGGETKCGIEEAVTLVKILDAIYRSANEQRTIDLE